MSSSSSELSDKSTNIDTLSSLSTNSIISCLKNPIDNILTFKVKWSNLFSLWKDRILIIYKDGYIIQTPPSKQSETLFNQIDVSKRKFISLQNAKIVDCPDAEFSFTILSSDNTKNTFSVVTKEEQSNWIKYLNQTIQNIALKHAFSEEFMKKEEEIVWIARSLGNKFDFLTNQFERFSNWITELSSKINTCTKWVETAKLKKEYKDSFDTVITSFRLIKEEMEKQFDEIVKMTLEYREGEIKARNKAKGLGSTLLSFHTVAEDDSEIINYVQRENKKWQMMEKNKHATSLIISGANNGNDEEEIFDDCNEISEKTWIASMVSPEGKGELNYTHREEILSYDSIYECKFFRNYIPSINNKKAFGSDCAAILKNKKMAVPIYYHEPWTILQKNCERFMYSYLLDKAGQNHESPALELCYIMGFIIAEMSLNEKRFLKPFNPKLGETFEYFDKTPENNYTYFSEHVSSNPPISAYYAENQNWRVFGDTRNQFNYKFFRGRLDVEFESKHHIHMKANNNMYVYNKPTLMFKGLVLGEMRMDYMGKVTITNNNNPNIIGEINFTEESQNSSLGDFEGFVSVNHKVKYLIKGNWRSYAVYSDENGHNQTPLWNIVDDKYLSNTPENYSIPSYSCNFNCANDEMLGILPPTDTRRRKDIKAYERRDIEIAQEIKNKLSEKEKKNNELREKENKRYQPNYFHEVFDQNSGDYVYVYKGGYWEDRKIGNFSHLNTEIFKCD